MSAQRKKEALLLELDFFVRLMCRIALSQLFSDTIKKREIDPDIPNHKATYRNTFDMFLIWAQMQEFINGHMVHLWPARIKKMPSFLFMPKKSGIFFNSIIRIALDRLHRNVHLQRKLFGKIFNVFQFDFWFLPKKVRCVPPPRMCPLWSHCMPHVICRASRELLLIYILVGWQHLHQHCDLMMEKKALMHQIKKANIRIHIWASRQKVSLS